MAEPGGIWCTNLNKVYVVVISGVIWVLDVVGTSNYSCLPDRQSFVSVSSSLIDANLLSIIFTVFFNIRIYIYLVNEQASDGYLIILDQVPNSRIRIPLDCSNLNRVLCARLACLHITPWKCLRVYHPNWLLIGCIIFKMNITDQVLLCSRKWNSLFVLWCWLFPGSEPENMITGDIIACI